MKLTYGDAKATLAPLLGLCEGDPRLDARVNEAVRRLLVSGIWVGTIVSFKVCSTGRFITVPREIEAVYEATACPVDESDTSPANGWYSVQGYSGFLDPDGLIDSVLLDRGEFPTAYDVCGEKQIRVYSDAPTEGETVRVTGIDEFGNVIQTTVNGQIVDGEILHMNSSPRTTSRRFTRVTGVYKTRSRGFFRLYQYDSADNSQQILSIMAPDETVAGYRRYYIPELPEEGATVRLTGKLRWVQLYNDSDIVPIRNLDAIKLMANAIMHEEGGTFELAAALRAEAESLLTKERDQYILDPTNIAERKAAFRDEYKNSPEGSLGYVRARLAIELPGAIKMGRTRLTQAILQALEKIVEKYNWYVTQHRLAVHDELGTIELDIPSITNTGPLPYTHYDTIKQMTQAVILQDAPVPESIQFGKQLEDATYQNLVVQLETALETKRHTEYTDWLSNQYPDSFEYMVARVALDIPGGLKLSREELKRLINESESRLMDSGKWKGTIFNLLVNIEPDSCTVYMPCCVATVLDAAVCNCVIPVRNAWFDFHPNGPGPKGQSASLIDQGEQCGPRGKSRAYKLPFVAALGSQLQVRAKIRFTPKGEGDCMVIKNYHAIKSMVLSLMNLGSNPEQSAFFEADAIRSLDDELKEYLGAPVAGMRVQMHGFAPSTIPNIR